MYLSSHCVRNFGGVFQGISRWLIKPPIFSFYVTIIAIMSTDLISFLGNAKAAMGMVITISCGGEAIVVKVKRRR